MSDFSILGQPRLACQTPPVSGVIHNLIFIHKSRHTYSMELPVVQIPSWGSGDAKGLSGTLRVPNTTTQVVVRVLTKTPTQRRLSGRTGRPAWPHASSLPRTEPWTTRQPLIYWASHSGIRHLHPQQDRAPFRQDRSKQAGLDALRGTDIPPLYISGARVVPSLDLISLDLISLDLARFVRTRLGRRGRCQI